MSEITDYEVNLERLTKQVEELHAEEEQLKAQQEAVNKAFKDGKITQQQYEQEMGRLNARIKTVAKAHKELALVVDKQKASLVDYKKKVSDVGDVLGKLGGIGAVNFGAIGGAIKNLVSGPIGVLMLAITALSKAYDYFAEKAKEANDELRTSLQGLEDRMMAMQTKKDDQLLNIYQQRVDLNKQDLKTEEEKVKLQQQSDEKVAKRYREILKSQQKQADFYGNEEAVKIAIAKLDKEIADADGKELEIFIKRRMEFVKIQKTMETIAKYDKSQVVKQEEVKLAQDKDEKKRQEDAKAKAEELERKRAELAKKRAEEEDKRREEAKKADEEALKQLEDLQIKMIKDEDERQKQQLILNRDRTIKTLEELSKKASKTGRETIEKTIKMLQKVTADDLVQVDTKRLVSNFNEIGVNIRNVLRDILTEGTLEAIDKAVKDGNQLISSSQLEEVRKNWFATYDALSEKFKQYENDSLKNLKEYNYYLTQLFRDLDKVNVIEPFPDVQTLADIKEYERDITHLTAEQMRYDDAIFQSGRAESEAKRAEDERYKTLKANIVAATALEAQRMEIAKAEKIKALEEEFEEEYAIRLEQANNDAKLLEMEAQWEAEKQERLQEIDADFEEKRIRLSEESNARMLKAKKNHEINQNNIHHNAENERTRITQEYSDRRRQIIAEEMSKQIEWVNGVGDAFNALAQIQQGIANDETKSNAQREKARRKALNLQIAQTFMSMASGLASGIANAIEAGFPAMFVTIPATVAMLIAEFAQVKQLMNQKNSGGYAEGGYVTGAGSGTSDSIPTNLSNGEYVVRASAVRDNRATLDAINYGNANSLATQLALAVQQLPPPVVSVQTIEQVQNLKNTVSAYSHL